MMNYFFRAACALALVGLFPPLAAGQVTGGNGGSFDSTALELEELDEIDVRTATIAEQRAFRTPAAFHVLTTDDIRRSGARTVPEVLRLVPGLHVAHVARSQWSVASRAFGGRPNNQPLVVIDGRRVYSPSFTAVGWETEPIPLEEILRIEVIRGPGAVAYGSNAVNGVINIVTRSPRSEGFRATVAPRYPGGGESFVRFADRITGRQYVRLWGQYDTVGNESGSAAGANARLQVGRAGFAADLRLSSRIDLEIDAAVTDGVVAEPRSARDEAGGPSSRTRRAFVLGRLEIEPHGSDADMNLHFLVDSMHHGPDPHGGNFDVYEAEFHQRLPVASRHEIFWGGAHRAVFEHRDAGLSRDTRHDQRMHLSEAVFQDTVAIIPTKLALTVGARLAHHNETGVLVDPEVRWTWSRTARQTWWTALSRASRPPSLMFASDVGQATPVGSQNDTPVLSRLGDESVFGTRRIDAVETGYRIDPSAGVVIDTAAFVNFYRDAVRAARLPVTGRTFGVESLVRWAPTAAWSVQAWYAANRANLDNRADSVHDAVDVADGALHRWQVRSRLNIGGMELDASVGRMPAALPSSADSYHHVDARIGRTFGAMELSLAAGNLINPIRTVYGDGRRRAARTVVVKATWRANEQ